MAKPAQSKPVPAEDDSSKKVDEKPTEPILTKESFEAELLAMKDAAQQDSTAAWIITQLSVLLQAATLLTLVAVYSNVSQLVLSPVFSSVPSSRLHSKGVTVACFFGWSFNLFIRRSIKIAPKKLLPIIAAYIPVVQFYACKCSAALGASYGPIVVESLTFLPLMVISVACTATILDDLEINTGERLKWLTDAGPGILSYCFFKGMEWFSKTNIQRVIGIGFTRTRLGMQVSLAGLYAVLAPSNLLLLTIPAAIHTALLNTHVQYPHTTELLNRTMITNGWALLDRYESVTGYVSVLQSMEKGFKVMRCDHSLLGGQWLASDKYEVAEPIYSVFVMLEAVRLVETTLSVEDKDANALVIGLGIGTTPSALAAHGISVTAVEIDPVIPYLAAKHFSLPRTVNVVIDDAISYVSRAVTQGHKYDYLIHDVFTGGVEPLDLFTVEFLGDLKSLLKDDGVIAINYAGDRLVPVPRRIIHTIDAVFPSCRIFRETPAPIDPEVKIDFINMVIFCKASLEENETIVFRDPAKSDFLRSSIREQFLLPRFELSREEFGLGEGQETETEIVTKENKKELLTYQQESAIGHWTVMRTVFTAEVWEDW